MLCVYALELVFAWSLLITIQDGRNTWDINCEQLNAAPSIRCIWHVHSQNCEKKSDGLLCQSFLSDCTSILTGGKKTRLSLDEFSWNLIFLYFFFFIKSVLRMKFSLKSDKNNFYFTWTPAYFFDHISFISASNEKCFRQICRENKNE